MPEERDERMGRSPEEDHNTMVRIWLKNLLRSFFARFTPAKKLIKQLVLQEELQYENTSQGMQFTLINMRFKESNWNCELPMPIFISFPLA